MAECSIEIFRIEDRLVQHLGKLVEAKAAKATRNDGLFRIAVSGGSLPKYLCQSLPLISTDWTKWRIFFCDERLVPFDDPESTFGLYKTNLIGKVPLQEDQFITINPTLSVTGAAQDYVYKLSEYYAGEELPSLDLLLLGMGPDGHTCSLFPGHKLLKEQSVWVAPISDSPKPPPCRITLTLPVINNAKCIAFVCTGASKADVLKRVLEDKDQEIPSALVKPLNGELHWILDGEAAAKLNSSHKAF